ncbi:hypothetical protein IG631_23682 [Alternaria alternata]|nr:hypothetical protein IG631_23682 [Alternaria alternata]
MHSGVGRLCWGAGNNGSHPQPSGASSNNALDWTCQPCRQPAVARFCHNRALSVDAGTFVEQQLMVSAHGFCWPSITSEAEIKLSAGLRTGLSCDGPPSKRRTTLSQDLHPQRLGNCMLTPSKA